MPYSIYQLIFFFTIYSFMGWTMETILCSVREKRFVNRGFLNGPFCPIYGVGMCIILLCLKPLEGRYFLLFLAGALLATILEFVTSWVMEKLFKATWWDYYDMPFNIQGRVCLPISLAWGGLALILITFVQPLVERFVDAVPQPLKTVLTILIPLYFLADTVASTRATLHLRSKITFLQKVKADLQRAYDNTALGEKLGSYADRYRYKRLSDSLNEIQASGLSDRLTARAEEWKENLRKRLSQHAFGEQRLLKAFPRAKAAMKDISLDDIRAYLKNKKKK